MSCKKNVNTVMGLGQSPVVIAKAGSVTYVRATVFLVKVTIYMLLWLLEALREKLPALTVMAQVRVYMSAMYAAVKDIIMIDKVS
jgi:hypothetical protein